MSESIKIERNGIIAEVIDRYLPEFLRDGWMRVDANENKCQANDIKAAIEACSSKDEIESLIKGVYGIDLDKRGSIEKVKDKALAIICESKPQ